METVSDLKKLCLELQGIEKEKSEAKEVLKQIEKRLDEKEGLIKNILTLNELDRFDFGNGLVYKSNQVNVKIVDKNLLKQTLGAENYEALASINAQTLKAYIKQEKEKALTNGNLNYILDGVEISEYENICLRKN
jgi:hypothetical protein